LLYRRPVDWLLCYVAMPSWPGSRTFYLNVSIQLLCEPGGCDGLTGFTEAIEGELPPGLGHPRLRS